MVFTALNNTTQWPSGLPVAAAAAGRQPQPWSAQSRRRQEELAHPCRAGGRALSDCFRLRRPGPQEPYTLHDGPPYANGDLHTGHALNKVRRAHTAPGSPTAPALCQAGAPTPGQQEPSASSAWAFAVQGLHYSLT
jgi:hypothetical protein